MNLIRFSSSSARLQDQDDPPLRESPPVVLVSLVRGPLRTYTLPSPVQNAALAGDSLVLAGRDGLVRVVDVNQLHITGEHLVGIEGHPAAQLVEQKGKVLAVPYSGRAIIVEQNGESVPSAPPQSHPGLQHAASMTAGFSPMQRTGDSSRCTWKDSLEISL